MLLDLALQSVDVLDALAFEFGPALFSRSQLLALLSKCHLACLEVFFQVPYLLLQFFYFLLLTAVAPLRAFDHHLVLAVLQRLL